MASTHSICRFTLDKFEFRSLILRSVILHSIMCSFVLLGWKYDLFRISETDLPSNILLVVLLLLPYMKAEYDFMIIEARLIDIHPGTTVNRILYILLLLNPAAYIVFIAYLCFSETTFKPLSKGTIIGLGFSYVFIFTAQLWNVQIATLTSSPTIRQLSQLRHDIANIETFNSSWRGSKNALDSYTELHPENLTPNEIALLTAVSLTSIRKERNRSIASGIDKTVASVEASIQLLEVISSVLKFGERLDQDRTIKSHPLQWIHPTYYLEFFLISYGEKKLFKNFTSGIENLSTEITLALEKEISQLSEDNKKNYSQRLFVLKGSKKFNKIKTI